RRNRIVEARRRRVGGNDIDLGAMRGQRTVKGRTEMAWIGCREGRQLEGAVPGGKQRILGGGWAVHSLHVVADRVSWRGPSRPYNVGTTSHRLISVTISPAGVPRRTADDTPRRPRKDIRVAGAVEQRSSEPRSPGCGFALTFGANL